MQQVDLIVRGASELATPIGKEARGGSQLGQLRVLSGGAVACSAGRIVAVGSEADITRDHSATTTLDANGGTIIPGFVDAHTHPVFLGTREQEFERRVRGESYLEIAAAGGGIASSLRGVRASSRADLVAAVLPRLDRFLAVGTTTVEAKSGYGLSFEDEIKSLEVIADATLTHPVDLVPTFLGAHTVPPEHKASRGAYLDLVVEEMLPAVAERGLARFCDVFTESGAFGIEESRRLLERAKELGLALRLHVDQLSDLGGARLAAELGASSADHLEHVSRDGIEALAGAGVVPVLCPLVPLYLREAGPEAPGRAMVEAGLAPALATDFNPGSCYLQSLPEVLTWAALRYGFSAGEGLTAATLNAAASLELAHEIGSLEPGKRADIVVLDVPNHLHLTYEFGRNPVQTVVKDGAVVFDGGVPLARGRG